MRRRLQRELIDVLRGGLRHRGWPARGVFLAALVGSALAGLVVTGSSGASTGSSGGMSNVVGTGSSLSPGTQLRIPPPPNELGCYRYSGNGWQRVTCDTQAYIKEHIPHPEVLAGLSGGVKVVRHQKETSGPIDVSVITAQLVDQQFTGEYDTTWGPDAASLQDNEFFIGNNKQQDGVQFTDQTISGNNNVCVWQITIPTQNYTSNCNTILGGDSINAVEGAAYGGILTVAAASFGNGSAIAVNVPDIYGLGVGHRWNNSSGGVLGYGGGSHAVYENTEMEIAEEVSSCLNDDGFIGFSVFCTNPKLKPGAYVSYSPGPSTNGYQTLETNNLTPVIGSPPKHLPSPLTYVYGGYTAQTNYTVTSTGKCWTGVLPYCQ
jgi:hypothetical protein